MAAKKRPINKPAKKPVKKPVDKVGIAGEVPPKKKPLKGKKIAIAGQNPPKRKKRVS